MLNLTATILDLDVARLSATRPNEVLSRSDGLLDLEIVISDPISDASSHTGAAAAPRGGWSADRSAISTTVAAETLVHYGSAQLSYLLLLPISDVQLAAPVTPLEPPTSLVDTLLNALTSGCVLRLQTLKGHLAHQRVWLPIAMAPHHQRAWHPIAMVPSVSKCLPCVRACAD